METDLTDRDLKPADVLHVHVVASVNHDPMTTNWWASNGRTSAQPLRHEVREDARERDDDEQRHPTRPIERRACASLCL